MDASIFHAIAQVGDAGLAFAGAEKLELARGHVVEKADAVAQEDGDEMYLHLVEQAGRYGARGDR